MIIDSRSKIIFPVYLEATLCTELITMSLLEKRLKFNFPILNMGIWGWSQEQENIILESTTVTFFVTSMESRDSVGVFLDVHTLLKKFDLQRSS